LYFDPTTAQLLEESDVGTDATGTTIENVTVLRAERVTSQAPPSEHCVAYGE
jgi:hypothetical protein